MPTKKTDSPTQIKNSIIHEVHNSSWRTNDDPRLLVLEGFDLCALVQATEYSNALNSVWFPKIEEGFLCLDSEFSRRGHHEDLDPSGFW